MEIVIQTKYDIGDKVRIIRGSYIDKIIPCPFCGGEMTCHTGVIGREFARIGPVGPPKEIVLTCQNCGGRGEISLCTGEYKRRVQRGVWTVTGLNTYRANGEVKYDLRLYDREGDPKLAPDAERTEYEADMIDMSAGFGEDGILPSLNGKGL